MWPTNLPAPGRPDASRGKRTPRLRASALPTAAWTTGLQRLRGVSRAQPPLAYYRTLDQACRPSRLPSCLLTQTRERLYTLRTRPPHRQPRGKSQLWANRFFARVSPLPAPHPGPLGNRTT